MGKESWRVNLGVFIFLLAFFVVSYMLGQVLTPFIAAVLFAYILNPAVNSLERRGAPRWLGAAAFISAFAVAICAVAAIAAYVLNRELHQLINNLPGYIDTFEKRYLPVLARYAGLAEDIDLRGVGRELKLQLASVSPESMRSAAGYAAKLLSGTLGFFLGVFNLVLIPVLMAYILVDLERLKAGIRGYLPVAYRDGIVAKFKEVEGVLRDFVKGQLMVAVILGVLYSIGLMIVGIDTPIVVGMGAGLLNLVPYLGGAVGIVVSLALAVLKFHDFMHPVFVLIVFAVVQTLEGYVITPKIVGERLGLHPVVIILSLMVLGSLLGFIGVLLAVPIAAVLKVFVVSFLKDYKESRLYAPEEEM